MKTFTLSLAIASILSVNSAVAAPVLISAQVSMTDNVKLATYAYLPDAQASGPYAVIFERTPYYSFYGYPADQPGIWKKWTDQGYAYVGQYVRGREGSGGSFRPWEPDGWTGTTDGATTVDWILEQSWCNGSVGTYGGSATAITSMMLAPATSGIICQISREGASNLGDHLAYEGDVFRGALCDGWLSAQGIPSYAAVWRAQPPTSTYWEAYDAETHAWSATSAGLHVGGYWDIFMRGTVQNFVARQYQGGTGAKGTQKLAMRPTAHGDYPTGIGVGDSGTIFRLPSNWQGFKVTPNQNEFAAYWLNGTPSAYIDGPPVTYYTLGDDQLIQYDAGEDEWINPQPALGWVWRTAQHWPPFPPRHTPYYLTSTNGIGTAAPPTQDSVSFTYDPSNPWTTHGGTNLSLPSGPLDQDGTYDGRSDVVRFVTDPLVAPVEATGHFKVRLFVTSDAPDTDFVAKLVDVYPAGDDREILMLDSIQRVKYSNPDGPAPTLEGNTVEIEVDLGYNSWIFNTGHRIGLLVSSSNSPRFDPNPNNGDDFINETSTPAQVAQNTVFVGGATPSALLLPTRDPDLNIDGDGETDEEEWNSPDGNVDGDSLTDTEELAAGTDPLDADDPPADATGSVQVTIEPQGARDAGAQWRVDGGAWQNSGSTVSDLSAGNHTVSYKTITGWDSPSDDTISVTTGQTTQATGTYTESLPTTGAVQVTIEPQAARDAGAQWQVDSGDWQSSGTTISNLAPGAHTVSFKDVSGWDTPASQNAQVNAGQTTTLGATYTEIPMTGSLQVTIEPTEAISAGAQWRVDGGAWQNSGTTISSLDPGTHTVSFNDIDDWYTPADTQVTIVAGQTSSHTGTYEEIDDTTSNASLIVVIEPKEARDANAQWSVNDNDWYFSNWQQDNLTPGGYTIVCIEMAGWIAPDDRAITLAPGETKTVIMEYAVDTGDDDDTGDDGDTGGIRCAWVPTTGTTKTQSASMLPSASDMIILAAIGLALLWVQRKRSSRLGQRRAG